LIRLDDAAPHRDGHGRQPARQKGFPGARVGHRYGAEHLDEVLGWCAEFGIGHVTFFVASVDNIR
jgi:short-chain Z-isoprenyl diphosphate synthase